MTTLALIDSPSQAAFLEDCGVVKHGQYLVLGHGSICGVDTQRFKPNAWARSTVRQRLHIDESETVICFLGRLRDEKGVFELLEASRTVQRTHSHILILAGPDEEHIRQRTEALGLDGSHVRWTGQVSQPEQILAAADVLCLPSYREGFGLVVIEAAACGIPAIASDVVGLRDSVIDGVTGLLVEVRNTQKLAAGMRELIGRPELRAQMGIEARDRVLAYFQADLVSGLLEEALLGELNR